MCHLEDLSKKVVVCKHDVNNKKKCQGYLGVKVKKSFQRVAVCKYNLNLLFNKGVMAN